MPEHLVVLSASEPNPESVTFHVTERALFRECRRKWQYQYAMNLEPVETGYSPLSFGTGIHKALQEYYIHDANPVQIWNEWCAANPDQCDQEASVLGQVMLMNYHNYAQGADRNWHPLEAELEISAECPALGVSLSGRIDLLIEDRKSGDLWIVDHKPYQFWLDDSKFEFDDQMTAYIWLARRAGYNVKGASVNQLRKKIPLVPAPLASGELSKRKDIDTTWHIYQAQIQKHGLKESDYDDVRRTLLGDNRFFRRVNVYRSQSALASFEENLFQELLDMSNPFLPIYPNFHRFCPSCRYATLCRTETEGGDIESVIQSLYKKNTRT